MGAEAGAAMVEAVEPDKGEVARAAVMAQQETARAPPTRNDTRSAGQRPIPSTW